MSAVGFGKSPQALRRKGKHKKAKSKVETYAMAHLGSDNCVHIVEIEAKSLQEASRKFDIFISVLDLCERNAPDEEILKFIQENPIDKGGEA